MTHPTNERAELEAQIAEREKIVANVRHNLTIQEDGLSSLRAQLAALDAEPGPDWEAWRPALATYCKAVGVMAPSRPFGNWDFDRIRGLIAALPLAPLAPRAAMDDAEIEALAWKCALQGQIKYEAAKLAIRATLSRVPVAGWPGDCVPVRRDVVMYLLGEGTLDGKWFGEGPPQHSRSSFWWRTALREHLTAGSKPADGDFI